MYVTDTVRSVAIAATLLLSSLAAGPAQATDADGWYRWQVEDYASAAACCYRAMGSVKESAVCKLDGGHGITIRDSSCADSSGVATIYIRKKDGQPNRVRVLDAQCVVAAESPITDMGTISEEEGVALLLDIVRAKHLDKHVREDALIWLAQSDSDFAFEYFDRLLSKR